MNSDKNILEVNTVEAVRMSILSNIIGKRRAVLRRGNGGRPVGRASPAADGQEGFNILHDNQQQIKGIEEG